MLPTGARIIDLSHVDVAQWLTTDLAQDEAFAMLEHEHRRRLGERQTRNVAAVRLGRDEYVAESIDWYVVGLAAVLSAATIKGYTDHKKHGILPGLGGRYARVG